MAEYINREATIALLTERLIETANNNVGYVCDAGITFQDAAERLRKCWINEIPVEEVEPVIRCRDCKYSEPWYADKLRCFLWNENGIDVFNDGFCNYGDKMEES